MRLEKGNNLNAESTDADEDLGITSPRNDELYQNPTVPMSSLKNSVIPKNTRLRLDVIKKMWTLAKKGKKIFEEKIV